ncbi:MAG TPA: ribonuclease HII [Acidimicrobiales bacterium]|jgi:ribonuclease HII
MAPKPVSPPSQRPAATRTARATKKAKTIVPASKVPTLNVERALWSEGHEFVVGVDEVGRGAWAGPLMVGAAVLPRDRRVYKVRDSKMLSEAQRERLFDRLAEWCVAWAVGGASQVECDELGMAEAQRLAARRAIDGLGVTPDQVLVDGNWDFVGLGCTRRIVKGDVTCLSISAASILAKVTRDRLMRIEAPHFPAYDFDSNKGYPCPRHKMALQAFGPTSIHRRTWVFMDHLPWTMRVYREAQAQLFDLPAREAAEPLFSAEIPQVDPWGAQGPARR